MTDKEKLEKIKALADKMYSRMAYLTSDTRPIRQAMDEYHQFIINEYHKEEPISEDLEKAAKDYSNNLDNIYGSIGKQTRYAFKAGAQWREDQMMARAIDAHCFGFQGAALFSFRLPAGNYLIGSKVKVIVIKED